MVFWSANVLLRSYKLHSKNLDVTDTIRAANAMVAMEFPVLAELCKRADEQLKSNVPITSTQKR